jgi:hypothetical protein
MDWIIIRNAIIHAVMEDDDFKDVTLGHLIMIAGVLPFTIGLIQLFTTGLKLIPFIAPSCAIFLFWTVFKNKNWFKKKL